MYPKSERILELLNSIEVIAAPTEQQIKDDKRVVEYIKSQESELFINDDGLEVHFMPCIEILCRIVEDKN